MRQTVHIIFVLNEQETKKLLNTLLLKSGIPVTVMDNINEISDLLDKSDAVLIQLTSRALYNRLHNNIIHLASTIFPGAHCILISSDDIKQYHKIPQVYLNYSYKGKTLEEVEKDHIIRTLALNGWHIQHTAKELGINRSTLYRKMIKYNIDSK